MRNLTETSRYLSLILRHKSQVIGIALDEHGWADVEQLIEGVWLTKQVPVRYLEKIEKR